MNLTRSDVASLLTAGAMAPSVQDTRPWRLDWTDGAVEVRGDAEQALTVADPDARELRLACGSAVANVHLALRAQGWRAHTLLLPDPAEPWFYARVRPGSAWPSEPWERTLATGIRHPRWCASGTRSPGLPRFAVSRPPGRERDGQRLRSLTTWFARTATWTRRCMPSLDSSADT